MSHSNIKTQSVMADVKDEKVMAMVTANKSFQLLFNSTLLAADEQYQSLWGISSLCKKRWKLFFKFRVHLLLA